MLSVGVDLISIARMERLYARFQMRALERFLNADEIALVRNPASVAGFWAAKEACAKALKCGIGKELGFHDILLNRSPKGAPIISLIQQKLESFKVESLSVSISHDGGFAVAVVAVVQNT